jgi:hypothetical protein
LGGRFARRLELRRPDTKPPSLIAYDLAGTLETTPGSSDGIDEREQIVRRDYRLHRRGTTPEAVLAFGPSEIVQRRVAELVEQSKEGSISAEDQSELEDYLQLEHIMIMAKARARQHMRLGQ